MTKIRGSFYWRNEFYRFGYYFAEAQEQSLPV